MPIERAAQVPVVIVIGQDGLGGAEHQLLYLLEHRDRARFDYHVIVLNSREPHTLDQPIRHQGVAIWRPPLSSRGVLRRVYYISCRLARLKPGVVHSWSFYTNPYVGLAGRLAGVGVKLGSMRNEPLAGPMRLNPLYRWLAYRSVSGLIVNSRLAANQILAMNHRPSQIHLVYNGVKLLQSVDASDASPDLTHFGILPEHRVVGTVGNLLQHKNHQMFIEAMALVLPQFPDLRCLIVGRRLPSEPGTAVELQDRIDALGLADRIKLAGVRTDVPRLMRRFAVFCLTSRTESMPNVVLEAMAASCPVVATRVGDVPYVIDHDTNGLLVDAENVSELAQAVTRLLRDRALSTRIGAAGHETVVAQFGCQRMAREIESIYLRALGLG